MVLFLTSLSLGFTQIHDDHELRDFQAEKVQHPLVHPWSSPWLSRNGPFVPKRHSHRVGGNLYRYLIQYL